VAERFKATVLKTVVGFTVHREFESHPFRQPPVHWRSPLSIFPLKRLGKTA
jgi:hypothetical protein